ncbi:hypothetical protein [Amycolatopsis pigmentata]|uniref:Uncharacterized protein n=1 Tax=Amycolatopsis pigmentata TaxID=450801 RepID=A0ABW5FYS3_9PSEU
MRLLDLSTDALESRFLEPYREGRAIVIDGKAILMDDLAALRINRTDDASSALRIKLQAQIRAGLTFATPLAWVIADLGEDVTDQFVTGPQGNAVPQHPVASVGPTSMFLLLRPLVVASIWKVSQSILKPFRPCISIEKLLLNCEKLDFTEEALSHKVCVKLLKTGSELLTWFRT